MITSDGQIVQATLLPPPGAPPGVLPPTLAAPQQTIMTAAAYSSEGKLRVFVIDFYLAWFTLFCLDIEVITALLQSSDHYQMIS